MMKAEWERRQSTFNPHSTFSLAQRSVSDHLIKDPSTEKILLADELSKILAKEKGELWKATNSFYEEMKKKSNLFNSEFLHQSLLAFQPSLKISKSRFLSWVREALRPTRKVVENSKENRDLLKSPLLCAAGRIFEPGNIGNKNPMIEWRILCTMIFALENADKALSDFITASFRFGSDNLCPLVLEYDDLSLPFEQACHMIDPFVRPEIRTRIVSHMEAIITGGKSDSTATGQVNSLCSKVLCDHKKRKVTCPDFIAAFDSARAKLEESFSSLKNTARYPSMLNSDDTIIYPHVLLDFLAARKKVLRADMFQTRKKLHRIRVILCEWRLLVWRQRGFRLFLQRRFDWCKKEVYKQGFFFLHFQEK